MFKTLAIIFAVSLASSHGFSIEPKIFHGIISETGDFPYFALISDGKFGCSASLLSDSWVITAGHCLVEKTPFNVSLGIRSDATYETTIEVPVDHQHIYPNYRKSHMIYDIGLVKLPHPVQLSESIRPTKLPQNCDDLATMEAVMALGIGQSHPGEPLEKSDKKLRQGLFETVTCKTGGRLAYRDVRNPESLICTYANVLMTAAGDSGGPLVRHKDGVQFGVHKGNLMESGFKPLQLFTRISFFFDWISQTTGLEMPKCKDQAPVDFE